ncbi:MAG: adenylosuccinate lyase [Bacteroidota bacterium]
MLTAVSPIDGRYADKTNELSAFFSEYALIKYRVFVEVEYFISLCNIPLPQLNAFDKSKFDNLRSIYQNFSVEDAQSVKNIEKVTNHDVKAVEYFIKDEFDKLKISEFKEFIHFGLTSQDINNTALPLSLKNANDCVIVPNLSLIINKLEGLAEEWMQIPMLARTHGQPASPTSLGKEVMVFVERLTKQMVMLQSVPFSAKFGGATGNFNAHFVAYPEVDWVDFGNNFVNKILGLSRSQITTQIEHYDNLAAYFDAYKRINTILIDFCRDIWTYVSMDYFKQTIKKGEVGSSAMPHKVNPIDFENAEGNLGIANAVFEHLSAKLPISRLQRDLTDSTVTRNVGVPIGHSVIACKSILKGIDKLIVNKIAIDKDLDNNWAVVAEAIQTVLRSVAYPNPYEALKELTRTNDKVNQNSIAVFIDSLNIDDQLKVRLKHITPFNYTGILPK